MANTPDERQQDQLMAIRKLIRDAGNNATRAIDMEVTFYALLIHLGEHEPAVADAIRYGMTSKMVVTPAKGWHMVLEINYPEGHPKR